MSLIDAFITDVVKFLTKTDSAKSNGSHKLVRFFESSGPGDFDYSFPLSLKIFKNYVEINEGDIEECQDNILVYSSRQPLDESIRLFVAESQNWTFAIDTFEIKDQRFNFKVKRATAFHRFLQEVTNTPSYGRCMKQADDIVTLTTDDALNPSITQFRVQLVALIVENLLEYSKFTLANDPSSAKHNILITSKSNLIRGHPQADHKLLTVGAVVDPKDKKISNETGESYVKKRCEDMHLMSIHKYGVRVKDDDAFKAIVAKLGRNAAILDLLEVKQSSAVSLTADTKQAFILYNSARMETLMGKFEEKVAAGYYEKLQDVSDIDTSLLKEEEEWRLLKLMLTFPNVIDRSINELHQGKVCIHLIHKFLSDIVNIFSVYYRRVRLLTENRAQLMPVLHAKIHFLRAVQKIMNNTLALLGIQPIASM